MKPVSVKDVSAERRFGTSYINTNAIEGGVKCILVVTVISSEPVRMFINGVPVDPVIPEPPSIAYHKAHVTIPPGSLYRAESDGLILSWYETLIDERFLMDRISNAVRKKWSCS